MDSNVGHGFINNICMSVFIACIRWRVSPVRPMKSPVLVINRDGCSCIVAISAGGTYYRRNLYTEIIVTNERNGIIEIINSRG